MIECVEVNIGSGDGRRKDPARIVANPRMSATPMSRKMMIQRISSSYKRRKVSSVRDFPQFIVKNERIEIGSDVVALTSETKEDLDGHEDSNRVGVIHHNYHSPKEVESLDSIMKKAGFNVAGNGNVGNGKFPPAKRKVPLLSESKVKPLSEEEGIRLMLMTSQTRLHFGNFLKDPLVARIVPKYKYSPAKKNLCNATTLRARANDAQKHGYSSVKKKLSNAVAVRLRVDAYKPTQHKDERQLNRIRVIPTIQQNQIFKDLSPREEVHKVLRHFKLVFDELDCDNAIRRGESKTAKSRIHYQTRTILSKMGMQVNCEKMIGPIPGVEVGDKFQFKAELNVIGLHFDIMGGIDYMKKGTMELATSINSSEGNDYDDRFVNGVMIYCGQGGNVKSRDQKTIKDQKLVGGNLALANNIKEKTPVRVILGKKRLDHRGKDYVYDGLYMVDKYWEEKRPQGNTIFKFKLSRIVGQPSIDF
ncbi:PREDICTED: LOW QUALITY PROTEIN: YDG domain-containing protein At5g47160-like [Camelina sativa]|uniref:LOW QUALITY PROTEIN: YDG domain-containing protein At5g47160-like n=1 Tax=Camelina sativa TaxID=90675 RepID=A0ABM0Y5D5_CAMSA|nr:PREDICTED: LOW QUALITY PROTEIN: YDG domain-containing protein At5g47160-like [Camelina sativa]